MENRAHLNVDLSQCPFVTRYISKFTGILLYYVTFSDVNTAGCQVTSIVPSRGFSACSICMTTSLETVSCSTNWSVNRISPFGRRSSSSHAAASTSSTIRCVSDPPELCSADQRACQARPDQPETLSQRLLTGVPGQSQGSFHIPSPCAWPGRLLALDRPRCLSNFFKRDRFACPTTQQSCQASFRSPLPIR